MSVACDRRIHEVVDAPDRVVVRFHLKARSTVKLHSHFRRMPLA
jgi:hypothetical protein